MTGKLHTQLNIRRQLSLVRAAIKEIEDALHNETDYNLQTRNPHTEAAILDFTAQCICEYFGFTIDQIKSRSRKGKLPMARHFFNLLIKHHFNGSVKGANVSKYLNRHHSSGIHGNNTAFAWIETNPDIADQWHDLRERYIKIAAEHFKN